MIIVGAGLSGLIAASMLREECSGIFEQQQALPNNHSALLRFRTSVVGDAVGIPFRKVRVMKAIHPWRNPVADALAYSLKAAGRAQLRSIVGAAGEVEERFIAPSDFIARLGAQTCGKFVFGQSLKDAILASTKTFPGAEPIISTVPMPVLMEALGWGAIGEVPAFGHQPGEVITVDLPKAEINVCVTVYLPNPEIRPYRASITDNRLIIEMTDANSSLVGDLVKTPEGIISQALDALGLWSPSLMSFCVREFQRKQMTYAKIVPIDEGVRRRFVMWASSVHGIYSLGRFATWRPSLLLDDVVNDVRVIQRLASNPGEAYAYHKKG